MSQEIIPAGNTLPAYLKNYTGRTGTEDIGNEDISLPRLKIGQSMSKEVKSGDVEEGDLFLNLTGEVLSPAGEPLPFVPLARNKEYILWRPKQDNGGGILARAKPVQTASGVRYEWDKPNMSFDVKIMGVQPVTWKTKRYIDEDGLGDWGSQIPGDNSSKIAATANHNSLVSLPTCGGMLVALCLNNTSAKRAKDFNALLRRMPGVPMWSRLFTFNTEDESKNGNSYKVASIKPSGFVSDDDFTRYNEIAKGFEGRTFEVDKEDAPSEDARL